MRPTPAEIRLAAEVERLTRERDEARADCAAQLDAFTRYVEFYGVEHLVGCPEDDTCECPLVVALNKAFGPDQAGSALLREVQALRRRLSEAYELARNLQPAGHDGDEESGEHDEDCEACAWEALMACLAEADRERGG